MVHINRNKWYNDQMAGVLLYQTWEKETFRCTLVNLI